MAEFLEELRLDAERHGHKATVLFHGPPIVTVRPAAFKRCLANLVSNAARHAPSIAISGHRDTGISQSLSTMTGRAFHPICVKRCSSRSCDSTMHVIRTRAARAWAWRSPATSRVHMAATLRSVDSPMGGLRATVRVPV